MRYDPKESLSVGIEYSASFWALQSLPSYVQFIFETLEFRDHPLEPSEVTYVVQADVSTSQGWQVHSQR